MKQINPFYEEKDPSDLAYEIAVHYARWSKRDILRLWYQEWGMTKDLIVRETNGKRTILLIQDSVPNGDEMRYRILCAYFTKQLLKKKKLDGWRRGLRCGQ